MLNKKNLIVLLSLNLVVSAAMAVQVIPKTLRTKSHLTKAKDGIYTSLDLKEKTLRFKKADNTTCDSKLARRPETLSYSCEIEIPTQARMSILEQVKSGEKISVVHGKALKDVKLKVSSDGKKITFMTEFDTSGIDFAFADLNDEIFQVYDQAASNIFAKAMQTPVKIEVLEN